MTSMAKKGIIFVYILLGGDYMASPLADRLRPKKIEEVAGQRHLLSEGKVLRRIIDSGNMPNLIFYGPSG